MMPCKSDATPERSESNAKQGGGEGQNLPEVRTDKSISGLFLIGYRVQAAGCRVQNKHIYV